MTALFIFPASLLRPLGGWLSDSYGARRITAISFGGIGLASAALCFTMSVLPFALVVLVHRRLDGHRQGVGLHVHPAVLPEGRRRGRRARRRDRRARRVRPAAAVRLGQGRDRPAREHVLRDARASRSSAPSSCPSPSRTSTPTPTTERCDPHEQRDLARREWDPEDEQFWESRGKSDRDAHARHHDRRTSWSRSRSGSSSARSSRALEKAGLRPHEVRALLARRDARPGRRHVPADAHVPHRRSTARGTSSRSRPRSLLLPLIGWFFAVQDPDTPYWMLLGPGVPRRSRRRQLLVVHAVDEPLLPEARARARRSASRPASATSASASCSSSRRG